MAKYEDPNKRVPAKKKNSRYDAEQAAMDAALEEFYRSGEDYINKGPATYEWLGDLESPEALSDTELAKIKADPRYARYEQESLRDLEQLSKDGLSLRDQADMAKLENDVNRQNAGRLGAIRQNMGARGISGSGLDLVAQQQAAQDATERSAIASLEKAAQAQEGRRDATSRLGALAGQLQGRDFQQQAAAAAAQDRINQFNTQGRNNNAMYNHQGRQGAADGNVGVQNDYRANVLDTRQNAAQMKYNASADRMNQRKLEQQQKRKARAGAAGGILGAAGGAVGAVYGGPAGAAVGYQAGNALGSAFYAHGGKVPGEAPVPGDHPANDVQPAMVSPGEIVIPRSIADDPNAAKKFVEEVNTQDAVAGLLKALEHMTKKKKG